MENFKKDDKTLQVLVVFCLISILMFFVFLFSLFILNIEEKGDVEIGIVTFIGNNMKGNDEQFSRAMFNYNGKEYEINIHPLLGERLQNIHLGDEVEIAINEKNPKKSILITGQRNAYYVWLCGNFIFFIIGIIGIFYKINEVRNKKQNIQEKEKEKGILYERVN